MKNSFLHKSHATDELVFAAAGLLDVAAGLDVDDLEFSSESLATVDDDAAASFGFSGWRCGDVDEVEEVDDADDDDEEEEEDDDEEDDEEDEDVVVVGLVVVVVDAAVVVVVDAGKRAAAAGSCGNMYGLTNIMPWRLAAIANGLVVVVVVVVVVVGFELVDVTLPPPNKLDGRLNPPPPNIAALFVFVNLYLTRVNSC